MSEEARLRIVKTLVHAARQIDSLSEGDELDWKIDRLQRDLSKHATFIHPRMKAEDSIDMLNKMYLSSSIDLDEPDFDDRDQEKRLIDKYADDDVDRDHMSSSDRRDDPTG